MTAPTPVATPPVVKPPMSREQIRARAVEKLAQIQSRAPQDPTPAAAEAVADPAAVSAEPKAGPATTDATPAVEVVAPPADAPKTEKPTSEAILAFERQRAAFAQQQASQLASLKKQQDELAAKEKERAADDALKTQDPYAWAEKHGITLRAWNERALNGGNKTPEEIAREVAAAEISEYKKQIDEDRKKERQEREAEKASAFMRQWSADLNAMVAAPPAGKEDKYQLTRVAEYQSMAKQIVEHQYAEDRRVYGDDAKPLTNDEALGKVEAHLEQLNGKFIELYKAKVLASQSAAQKSAPKVTQGGNGQSPRTLDPDSLASPPPNPEEDADLSKEERKARRRQRAMALLATKTG